jgi:hypothetical protein
MTALLAALLTRRKPINHRLITQRAVRIRIPRILAAIRTRHHLLGSILRTTTPRRGAEVARQVARLKDDAWTAALWLAFLADAVGAARVLAVALGEGDLGRVAIPGAVAETVVFEAAAGGAETGGEVVAQGLAARGVVFGLVGDFAFDADGL